MPAYEITLEDAKNDVALKQISGTCSSSAEFLALINEAEKALAIRGGWFDLQQRITFCLSGCRIVWPDFVGTIKGVRFCRGGLASMQNQWYSFVNNNFGGGWGDGYGRGYGGYGDNGYAFNGAHGHRHANCVIEDDGTRPCYNEISGTTGKQIRYCVVKAEDVGKKITLFGKQYGEQPLQERQDGAWVMGQTLTAANPYIQTANLITEISSITREATNGMAYLYEYDPNTGLLRDLAVFKPYETNPRYRCSRIQNRIEGRKDSNGVCWTSIEALVKLKFIPLVNDRDFLPISNLRAVKLAIQAIQAEQANNDELAQTKWAKAVEDLTLELEDKQPKKQIPVRVNLGRTISNPI